MAVSSLWRRVRLFVIAVLALPFFSVAGPATAEDLLAAVLPNARTVSFGNTATAFATALNISGRTLTNCGPTIPGVLPGTFTFRPTNPATNQPTGPDGQLINIAANAAGTFVFSFRPTQVFSSRTFPIVIQCSNAVASRTTPGVSTFTLGVSDFSPPDIIAITQTVTQDGVVRLPSNGGTVPFVAAAINIGNQKTIVIRPEISGANLPLGLTICETNAQGQCAAPHGPSITTTFAQNGVKTFTVNVTAPAGSPVAFDPAVNRIALNFIEDGILRANSSVAVATNGAPTPPVDPEHEGGASAVILALSNTNPNGFVARTQAVQLSVAAGSIDTTVGATKVWLNDLVVPAAQIAVTASQITVSSTQGIGLKDGRNVLRIRTRDTAGDLVNSEFVVWAGSATLTATVRNTANQLIQNARVQFRLNEDETIFVQLLTDAQGVAAVPNLPDLPINVYAYSPNLQESGSSSVQGNSGAVAVTLTALDPASTIDNNEFQLGNASGWVVNAPSAIVPHDPGPSGDMAGPSVDPDNDLRIGTSGTAKQTAKRTIEVPAGTGPAVTFNVRHRFSTTEVPGGYCGTKYNDAFGVEMRVVVPNAPAQEPKRIVSAMNQLGCAAFDATGTTKWMDSPITVPRGASLEVVASVQNVGDGAFQSTLTIDGLIQPPLIVSDLQLKDLLNNNLQYLSISSTLPTGVSQLAVRGRIVIKRGVSTTTARVTGLVLKLRQGTRTVNATLSPAAATALINVAVPDPNGLEWNSTTQPLFIIPHASLTGWDTGQSATVSLSVDLTPTTGKVATKNTSPQSFTVMTRGSPTIGRYPERDPAVGGDEWGRKKTIDFLVGLSGNQSTMTFNDASKMHAGKFPPHGANGTVASNHDNGTAVDMKFPNFPSAANARSKTAANADAIIQLLADHGTEIEEIGTTFPTTNNTNRCRDNFGNSVIDTNSLFFTRLQAAGHANANNTGKVKCYADHGHIHVDVNNTATTADPAKDILVRARELGMYAVSGN